MPYNTWMKVPKTWLTFDSETLKSEQSGSGQARAQTQKSYPEKPPQGAVGSTLPALCSCARTPTALWAGPQRLLWSPAHLRVWFLHFVTLTWEGSLGENVYMCVNSWVPSLFT